MALETIVAGVGVLILTVSWYGLQIVALRDLRDRPTVRGENKLLWAFTILCLPYAGAVGYLAFGSTSFLTQPDRRSPAGPVIEPDRSSRRSTAAPSKPALADRRAIATPGAPVARTERRPRPATAGRPARRLAHDPVIGTDSSELLPSRVSVARIRRPVPDTIRWPGSAVSDRYQPADAELHD